VLLTAIPTPAAVFTTACPAVATESKNDGFLTSLDCVKDSALSVFESEVEEFASVSFPDTIPGLSSIV
jgi:hypothetical protein